MKKVTSLSILLLLVCGSIFLQACSDKTKYESVVLDDESYESILYNSEVLEEDDAVDVIFDGQTLLYEEKTETYYYSLNEDKKAVNPSVIAYINGEEAQIAFLNETITYESIRNNESIAFIVYNDVFAKEYRLVCSTLPIVNFTCEGLEETDEEKTSMSMILYDNRKGVKNRVTVSDGKIGIRGASTRKFPKKSFKFSLRTVNENGKKKKNNVSLLGMPEQDDWILYAAYNDGEKIRNVFSQNLWYESCARDNKNKICAGLNYKYVEMFVNNEYYGLYALGYQLSDKLMNVDDNSTLYKKAEWDSENRVYMFQNYYPGYKLWDDDNLENEEIIDYAYWDRLLSMYYFLQDEKKDSSKLRKCIDENNAIDFYLFLNLVQGFDNVLDSDIKNMFLYIADDENGNYQLYVPWDLDLTWGNIFTDDEEINSCLQYGVKAEENAVWETGYLNQIIVNADTDINEKIISKYRVLRKKKWSNESIIAMLDEYEADIYFSGAILREKEKWPGGSYSDTDIGLQEFKDYVLLRLSEMDKYVDRLENLKSGNTYVRRSKKYHDFENKIFLLQINDKKMLDDEEFREFTELIGIEADHIKDDVNYIFGSTDLGYDYLAFSDVVGERVDTELGTLENVRLTEEEGGKYYTEFSYSVLLNKIPLYDTYPGEVSNRLFMFDDCCGGSMMYFDKDYEMILDITTFNDFSLYMKAVKYTKGTTNIVINNRKLMEDPRINDLIGRLAVGDKFTVSYGETGANSIQIYTSRKDNIIDNVLFTFIIDETDGQIKATQIKCDR